MRGSRKLFGQSFLINYGNMKVLYDEFVALRKSVNLGMHVLKADLDRIN